MNYWKALTAVVIINGTMVTAHSSVQMLNTRVIYPGGEKFKTIQFSNPDNIPYIMQVWSDTGTANITSNEDEGPMLSVPSVFRIEPNAGQSIRLFYNGGVLPKDKETIFYLNTYQVPPKNVADGKNKIALIVKNRNKIFYRPDSITGEVQDVPKKLEFKITKVKDKFVMNVHNPTGYFATLTMAQVECGKNVIKFPVDMIPPKSSKSWEGDKKAVCLLNNKVNFKLINDFGGIMQYSSNL